MGKKRIYRTIFGIPVWTVTGISIFIIFSVLYDLIVGDKNIIRYAILVGAMIILISSIIMHLVPAESVGRMARRQMGGV